MQVLHEPVSRCRSAPAANFAPFTPQAGGGQTSVELLSRNAQGVAELAFDAVENAAFARLRLDRSECRPRFVNQRAGDAQVDRALSAGRVAHDEHVIRTGSHIGPAAPSGRERSLTGEPLAVGIDKRGDGRAALVNRIAIFQNFCLSMGADEEFSSNGQPAQWTVVRGLAE